MQKLTKEKNCCCSMAKAAGEAATICKSAEPGCPAAAVQSFKLQKCAAYMASTLTLPRLTSAHMEALLRSDGMNALLAAADLADPADAF
jgi:hypothetical protein